MTRTLFQIATFASAAAMLALPALAADKPPVVVELFTSQGCSSCPPANANLIKLSQRPDVLALSFAVTYWDYLGWKDSFDAPEYTDRQVAYEPPLGQQGPPTRRRWWSTAQPPPSASILPRPSSWSIAPSR